MRETLEVLVMGGLLPERPLRLSARAALPLECRTRSCAEGERSGPGRGRARAPDAEGGGWGRGGAEEGAGRWALRSVSSAACTAHQCPLLLRSF